MQTEPQESLICCCCLSEDLKFAAFGQENGAIKVLNLKLDLENNRKKTFFLKKCHFNDSLQ